jgi:hypothetical protein
MGRLKRKDIREFFYLAAKKKSGKIGQPAFLGTVQFKRKVSSNARLERVFGFSRRISVLAHGLYIFIFT